ncbi:circadian locomoter output cycles protein kaput-like isoform X2 [Mercenaria mercenaria]|uniref:circadian locomoter output cycles protein kaput-like isoform X2 n=1 Tax=Mercenaria mercenaria TaxID=6596 RepID=UPI00234F6415|nr:circadian locomoter output cycles protein kaput-like isoform X2 [Mercenaria mercenaria]
MTDQADKQFDMNYSKRIALSRSSVVTDSDSAIGEDYDDDGRSHKRAGGGKDKINRNLSEKKRRDQFNMLVNELCTMVSTTNKKMDKSTVLKSTIAFLKDHQETTNQSHVHEIKEDWKPSFLTNDEFMHLMLEACDSFLLVFTQQGVILYTSESITSLLGHLPSDMVNKSIYDFVGKTESANLHNILYNYRVASGNGIPEYEKEENQLCFECNFCRGSIEPRDPPRYEPVIVRGSSRHTNSFVGDEDMLQPIQSSNKEVYFLCTVRLKTSQLVREMSIVDDNKEFTSRHSLEWKFLFLDHRAPPIIGYLPFEVLGTSGYDYYHPDDLDGVTVSHEQLMKTGEGTSCYYRFLTKGQQWIWLKTRFYITYHQWNSKPEFINCTNTVVSYADVRGQKRKDLGIAEEDTSNVEIAPAQSILSQSPGSVTSAGRSVCSVSEKEGSDNFQPTSTSQVRSRTVSQQLQQFLHRHLQQQQQQQQQLQQSQTSMTTCTVQSQATHPTSSTTSYSTLPLQQLLYGRPQRHEKTDTQHMRILPCPSTSNISDQQTRLQVPSNTATDTNSMVTVTSNPSMISISPINTGMSAPTNIYMTPVQRQLHEQLQRKAGQVQDAILRQQEELRKIHQQLLFAQGNIPVLNSNSDNMAGLMGGEHSRVEQSAPTLPAIQHQQQQQSLVPQSQQAEQHSPGVPMVGMPNMMVNQSQVLPFPMLPQDAEIYLSLTDTAESPQSKYSQQ